MIKTGDVHVSRIELNKPKTKKNKFNEYSIHTTYTCTNCNTANVIFNVTNKKIKQVCKGNTDCLKRAFSSLNNIQGVQEEEP